MKGKQIRQITDGSIIVAIYGMIFLLSRFTGGQIEYSFSFIMPLPLAIYSYKYDLKNSLIPFVATILLSFFLSANPFNSILIVMPLVFSGGLLGGVLIKKNVKPIYSILIIGIFSGLMEVLSAIVFSNILGMENIFNDISNLLKDFEKIIHINSGDFVIIQALMEGMIPSIIIVISLMSSMTTYLIYVILIRRIFKGEMNKQLLQIFSLNNLIPKPFTAFYCLVLLGSFLGVVFFRYSEGFFRVLLIVLINASFIIGAIYFYFGLKVAALFINFTKKKFLIIFEFAFIFIFPPLFTIIGIFDNILGLQTKIYNKIVNTNQN